MSDAETSATTPNPITLTAIEARILGSLIEKQATTPEVYPLTLNALVTACNQKTSREPVMNLAPGEVGQCLRALDNRRLTYRTVSSRADRWEHRVDKALELTPGHLALIGMLLLRGPQTIAELLTRTSRLHAFADAETLTYQLERLIPRGLVVKLPRQVGQREERYMHLLCGPIDVSTLAVQKQSHQVDTRDELEEKFNQQQAKIAELETRIELLEEQLGNLLSELK